jgi:hypothetical protein
MAQKEKQLTAAEIAARRPQAAKVMKRKDGSTYNLGASFGGAPKTSPAPKTRPAPTKTAPTKAAPAKTTTSTKSAVTAKATASSSSGSKVSGSGVATMPASGKKVPGRAIWLAAKNAITGGGETDAGKVAARGTDKVPLSEAKRSLSDTFKKAVGYAKGGMVKGKACKTCGKMSCKC